MTILIHKPDLVRGRGSKIPKNLTTWFMDDTASQKPVVKKGYRILSRMTFWQFCISKATEQRPRISQKCRSNSTYIQEKCPIKGSFQRVFNNILPNSILYIRTDLSLYHLEAAGVFFTVF